MPPTYYLVKWERYELVIANEQHEKKATFLRQCRNYLEAFTVYTEQKNYLQRNFSPGDYMLRIEKATAPS